jgi:iron complex outermembrane receptor protein
MFKKPWLVCLCLCASLGALLPASALTAQEGGTLELVVETPDPSPVTSFEVEVLGTNLGVLMVEGSRATVDVPSAGTYEVIVQALGYRPLTIEVSIIVGATTSTTVQLEPLRFEAPGVTVTALRPDLRPVEDLSERIFREANPVDVGEMLRDLPGVDSVRRGPLGFDPVVRGLRETQVGVYLDDARIFPAGPGGMDSSLSHFDPATVRSVEVVKGPYALTWGAGNLTSIQVRTAAMPPATPGVLHGNVWGGFGSNSEAAEGIGQAWGRSSSVSYWAGAAYRSGNDYTSGDGTVVPADYTSAEGRAKLGIHLGTGSDLTLTGSYQDQNDIDYPGRQLDANFFKTTYGAARYDLEASTGLRFGISGYYSFVDHQMQNDNKPTAQDMPGRIPPFALAVQFDTESRGLGGRTMVQFDASPSVNLEFGADLYHLNQNALRQIARRSTGMVMVADTPWPDVSTDVTGLFGKVETNVGSVNLATTVRADFSSHGADESLMSPFFLAQTEGPYDPSFARLGGALTASMPVGNNWSVSAGLGSTTRTPQSIELYSDRFPSTRAQTSAEFFGNPQLVPERSNQADLWLEGRYHDLSIDLSTFYRRIDDYITLESTDLPKKLPMAPPTVYRYINGDAAFWGAEGRLAYRFAPGWMAHAQAAYLWGQDRTLGEPALGISPFRTDLALRFDRNGPWYAQAVGHFVAAQDRVATSRNESPTDGFTTFDLTAGWRSGGGFDLHAGIMNVTDEQYVNHLNARNPFTRQARSPGVRSRQRGRTPGTRAAAWISCSDRTPIDSSCSARIAPTPARAPAAVVKYGTPRNSAARRITTESRTMRGSSSTVLITRLTSPRSMMSTVFG